MRPGVSAALRCAVLVATLAASSNVAALSPQPTEDMVTDARARFASLQARGYNGDALLDIMRRWYGQVFEGAAYATAVAPGETEVYLVRRDARGYITFRAFIGTIGHE